MRHRSGALERAAYSKGLNLLLTGPPASGKSTEALARFHSIPGSILLTPTATMAEHLRNEMARSGLAIRPNHVQTLAGFVDQLDATVTAPAPLVQLAIEDALDALQPARFRAVAEFLRFRAALAQLFEEAPEGLGLDPEVREIFQFARERIRASGFSLRRERLLAAANAIGSRADVAPHILIDGLFTLSSAELAFVEALASRTQVTVVLPDVPGALAARERLVGLGFEWRPLEGKHREPARSSFQTASIDQEAEEIARRILKRAECGCAFREMGIVLRSREPYGPILETTLARFGIPVRSYFAPPLLSNPTIGYLAGLVRALLSGWNHADLNGLLRMPVSGLGATPAGDQFDFRMREMLPGRGLPVRALEEAPEILLRLEEMNSWTSGRLEPAQWSARLKNLFRLIPDPVVTGQDSFEQVSAWRSIAVCRALWEEAADLAAMSSKDAVSLKQFWQRAETILAGTPLRIPDRRRNAVALLDVFEARQWQLRIVFVPGLTERLFPHYHREDPIVGDAARARLGLATALERQREERFLFDLACSRAVEETVLSYARLNEKGDEVLASFFLDHSLPALSSVRARPLPSRNVNTRSPEPIQDADQLARLADRHKTISPTAIEDFLQCPFLFFSRRTMRLKDRPPAPRDRLGVLLQGSILHRALAVWAEAPIFGSGVLSQVFDEEIARHRIPHGYRTEAVRLELLRHFEAFLRDGRVPVPRDVRIEQNVTFPLNSSVSINGRIDRVDVGPGKEALVIDYKYSADDRIRERVEESQEGQRVQAGLYLLAAEKALRLEPAGMLYCGLRKKVSWNGWHVNRRGLETVGEARSAEALRELIDGARSATLEAHAAILKGSVDAKPRDPDQCKRCDFSDICRVETLPVALEAGAE